MATPRLGCFASQGSQIEVDDLGVVEELLAGARVGVPSLVEDIAAVGDAETMARVLLDKDTETPLAATP